jgi:hypothetical protein
MSFVISLQLILLISICKVKWCTRHKNLIVSGTCKVWSATFRIGGTKIEIYPWYILLTMIVLAILPYHEIQEGK